MSLLTALNNVATEAKVDTFDSIIGNTIAEVMLKCAHDCCDEVSKRGDWSDMLLDAVITPVAEESDLPTQFHRMQGDVVPYNTNTGEQARNGRNRGMWQIITRYDHEKPYFLIEGQVIKFSPWDALEYTVPYVSTYYARSDVGASLATFTNDTDTTAFPEILLEKGTLWRYLRTQGHPYEDELAEFEAQLLIEIEANRGKTA